MRNQVLNSVSAHSKEKADYRKRCVLCCAEGQYTAEVVGTTLIDSKKMFMKYFCFIYYLNVKKKQK